MRVLIAYDEPTAGARADELDVLAQADAVERALRELGHEVERAGVGLDLAAARAHVLRAAPDVVFNLVESLGGSGRALPFFPAVLEELGCAFTGSSSDALASSGAKTAARERMRAAGLPIAPGWTSEELARAPAEFRPGRYIVKSVWEHASIGLDDGSIVDARDARALAAAIDERAPRLGGVAFAEAFVDGRELNLSVLAASDGPEVLPPAEIRFVDYAPGRPRIVGYRAKWDERSFEYHHTPRTFDFAPADAPLVAEVRELARRAWRTFRLRGWARVDFRVDEAGRPWILEVNANPCLAPDAGFAAALERAGIPFARAIERILADAVRPVGSRRAGAPGSDARSSPARAGRSAGSRAGESRAGESSARASGAPRDPRALRLRDVVRASDARAVHEIVASSGFFHAHEIDVAVELVDERLKKGDASGYHFLFLDGEDGPAGYACFGPIACTEGSYDLFWIAVHEAWRGRGFGRRLLQAAERAMAERGARAVWVETSSRALYEPTRAFYRATGYEQCALLPDFYAPGDGKVVFVKHVATPR